MTKRTVLRYLELNPADVARRSLLIAHSHAVRHGRPATQEALHEVVCTSVREIKAGKHWDELQEGDTFFRFLGRVIRQVGNRPTSKAEKRRKVWGA